MEEQRDQNRRKFNMIFLYLQKKEIYNNYKYVGPIIEKNYFLTNKFVELMFFKVLFCHVRLRSLNLWTAMDEECCPCHLQNHGRNACIDQEF